MFTTPMQILEDALRRHALVSYVEEMDRRFASHHLKELVADNLGPHREMEVAGRCVINFGSDSFLGLDQDPRVRQAITHGLEKWGTHNGASRVFSQVRAGVAAEQQLAAWLGTEEVLLFASVSLANLGALPGLVGRGDLLAVDEQAHNSIQEAAKIAKADGVCVVSFRHRDPGDLERVLENNEPYRLAVVAVDGVYSMTGALAPLPELNRVALKRRAILYVDDAHGTGVLGRNGRGTVLDALGNYDNTFVVGSLSKAFSCFGGFIGCPARFKKLLKIRSNTYIFGGPVPPPYLEAIPVVCAILASPEYNELHGRLQQNYQRLVRGANRLGLAILGGQTPIVSILVGEEEAAFAAGHFLFERGFFVQSVTFPAVPYHLGGVLRIQVNANHEPEAIDRLLEELKALQKQMTLPVTGRSAG
jgi:7-keto-8-aminopelargonate synthetase-like enzyme